MTKEILNRLAKAFDADELDSTAIDRDVASSGDGKVAGYHSLLHRLDVVLKSPPAAEVPEGFTARVLNRLPSVAAAKLRTFYPHDFVMPVVVLLVMVLSFVFAEPLGITHLLELVGGYFSNADSVSSPVVFVVASSVGILLAFWLIISSFFGIRHRRYVR